MRIAVFASSLLLSVAAVAEPLTYAFDKAHSQIHASVNHLGFSNSTARFLIKDGTLTLDVADPTTGKVDVTIDANSMDFGDATWKEHVSADKWFNVASFPDIRFVSTKVTSTGKDTMAIEGNLTLRGVTKPVTLNATLNKAGEHPFSKKPAVGFSATATFKRSEFGMDAYVPNVGDDVSLRIEIEASAG